MPFCELDFEQNKNEITAILINKVMRKEQTKRDYSAQPGGSMGDAKQAPGWLSESEDEDENPAWED